MKSELEILHIKLQAAMDIITGCDDPELKKKFMEDSFEYMDAIKKIEKEQKSA